jgi:hypothetical protein
LGASAARPAGLSAAAGRVRLRALDGLSEAHELALGQPPLEQAEEVTLLEADVIVQQLSEPVRHLEGGPARAGGKAVDRGADPRMLVAHARRGLAPVGVGLRQGREDEPLLDLEVPASARFPEGLQLRDGRLEVACGGTAQRERRLQGMVVVARERGEAAERFTAIGRALGARRRP